MDKNRIPCYTQDKIKFNNNSKDSPTSIGGEMNCYWKINGSGGRREIGIPH